MAWLVLIFAVALSLSAARGQTSPEIESPEENDVVVNEHEEPSVFQRTVILIHKETYFGEQLFIRGGIDYNQDQDCGNRENLDEDPCSIPIRNRKLDIEGSVEERDAWAEGDAHLDWYGPEYGQGESSGIPASGTPAQWTTDDVENDYHSSLNTFGPHYWLVDIEMDCSKTEGRFFELKAVLNNQWEPSYSRLDVPCSGDESRDPPYQSGNHFAQCGFVNVFEWGQGECQMLSFEEDEAREEEEEKGEEEEEEEKGEEEEEEEGANGEEEEEEAKKEEEPEGEGEEEKGNTEK